METYYNIGTDDKPLDSFGRPVWKLLSMVEYQMAKKEFERIDRLKKIKLMRGRVARSNSSVS